MEILPLIRGYRHAIIVDAIQSYQQPVGTVMIYDPDDFEDTIGDTFAHDINIATALKIGRQMNASTMPESIRFVAIEVKDIQTMSESMTAEIEATVEPAKNAVLFLLDQFRDQDHRYRNS